MDHATSYQHCTQSDEPAAEISTPPELHMLKFYATEIGVIIGHIEGDSSSGYGSAVMAKLAQGYVNTLRRIRAGLNQEISDLAVLLSERES